MSTASPGQPAKRIADPVAGHTTRRAGAFDPGAVVPFEEQLRRLSAE